MKKLIILSQLTFMLILGVAVAGLVRPARVSAAPPGDVFAVNSTNDGSDANPGDGICETATPDECTLRAAVEEANNNGNPTEQDIIGFDISGGGVHTISRGGNEYNITQNVLIDGYTTDGSTSNGSTKNTAASPAAFDAVLTIEIESSGANLSNTFLVNTTGDGTVIKGLVINNSQAEAIASLADDVSIQGCFIGTDPTGLVKEESSAGGLTEGDSANLQVGGTDPADRNIIVGAGQAYYSSNATGTVFEGNYFDVGSDGLTPLPHTGTPTIVFLAGDSGAMIGGNTVASKNVINNSPGAAVSFESGTHDNQVAGNEIMGNSAGAAVGVSSGSYNIMIGGSDASYGNVMSDNYQGVSIAGASTHDVTIMHNLIGTDVSGNSPLPNSGAGILVTDAFDVTISDNTISNNVHGGIGLSNNSGATISNNTITSNGDDGLSGTDSDNVAVTNNLISGNTTTGITGSNLDDSTVSGNLIGTSTLGVNAVPNGDGIILQDGSSGNTIGGTSSIERNIISGNTGAGVTLTGTGVSSNTISGNYIGTDVSGTAALPNAIGIALLGGPTSNTIGGSTAASRNIVTGNPQGGINLIGGFGTPTNGNVVQNNYIGADANGNAVGWNNQPFGIVVAADANDNLIGGESPSEGNLVRGSYYGVYMVDLGGSFTPDNNPIIGNSVFDNLPYNIEQCTDSDLDFMCDVAVGPNVNDAGDPDVGPNDLENTPVITGATYSNNSASVTFNLDAGDSPGGQYHVEFFASMADGAGQTYLGFANVSNGNGQVANSLIIPDGFDMSGKYITATATQYDQSYTATNGYGSTSEYSAGVVPTLQATTVSNPVTGTLSDTGQNNLRAIIFALVLITLGSLGLITRHKLKAKQL